MKVERIVTLMICLAAFALPCRATGSHKNAIQISSYNLIFTKIKINGREVLALIDSGSFRSVELSSTLAKELKLSLDETKSIARRYEGKDLFIKSGRVDSLAIGEYEKRNVDIDVIDGDIENISKKVNTSFDVILGWGFLSRFYTLIDYKNRSLILSESPLKLGKDRVMVNYTVVKNVPTIKGIIDGIDVTLLFDTAAPMCNIDLSLVDSSKGEKVTKEIVIENNLVRTEWRIKDLTTIKQSLGCSGVIGNSLLKDYAIYFDTANKVIHFY